MEQKTLVCLSLSTKFCTLLWHLLETSIPIMPKLVSLTHFNPKILEKTQLNVSKISGLLINNKKSRNHLQTKALTNSEVIEVLTSNFYQ